MPDALRHAWIRPLPNVLTGLRIVGACALPFVPEAWWLPLVLFAGVSDWLDGWIARRFGATSRAGALLDGIADKLFVLAAVVTFVSAAHVPLWRGLLVMARDVTVGLIAAWCALHRAWAAFDRMEARLPGKLTTAFVIPWFATLLVPALEPARLPLFVLASGASVVAAVDYFVQFRRQSAAAKRA